MFVKITLSIAKAFKYNKYLFIMKLISHRGNLYGPNKLDENNPQYVSSAVEKGFDVEIDVFFFNDSLWLGHDEPVYKIDVKWLMNNNLWCHAKNLEALDLLLKFQNIHCFWHQNDDFTLTSKGYIWTYPEKQIVKNSILVITNDIEKEKLPDCYGVCSDFVGKLK